MVLVGVCVGVVVVQEGRAVGELWVGGWEGVGREGGTRGREEEFTAQSEAVCRCRKLCKT